MGEVLQFARPGVPSRPEGDYDVVIHQRELQRLKRLRKRWGKLTRGIRALNDSILWRLLNNHPVEPGDLSAYTVQMPSACFNVTRGSYWMVKVK